MKKSIAAAYFLVIVCAAFSARASDETELGKVRGLYSEAARGVLVAQSVAKENRSARRWADVDLGPAAIGQRRVLVELPAELRTEPGDLVRVKMEIGRLRAPGVVQTDAPVAQVSRVLAVQARWFTEQAQAFGEALPSVAALFSNR